MRSVVVVTRAALAVLLLVLAPSLVRAQEISVSGVVTDTTDAVLPGATVTALHVESGNTFVAVADATGEYRIGPLRPGLYRVTAELQSFSTVVRENLELLVGQRGTVNFKLSLSSVNETVTVTGASPLVDVVQSKLGGNVDSRQLSELPVNGRNWMDLTMLAPGSNANAVGETPVATANRSEGRAGEFQLNLDGQQVSNMMACARWGQPQVQPRRHRRVRVREQPVRRDAGPLDRRAGQRRHESGHQQLRRHAVGLLPRRQAQCQGLHRQARAALLEPADQHHLRRTRSGRIAITSSATTRESASRSRISSTARIRASTSAT